MNTESTKPSFPSDHRSHGAGPSTRQIDSAQILAGEREVVIRHDGVFYKLRSTSNGKLILTK